MRKLKFLLYHSDRGVIVFIWIQLEENVRFMRFVQRYVENFPRLVLESVFAHFKKFNVKLEKLFVIAVRIVRTFLPNSKITF